MKDVFCRLVTEKLARAMGTSMESLLSKIIESIYWRAKNKPLTGDEVLEIIEEKADEFVNEVLDG